MTEPTFNKSLSFSNPENNPQVELSNTYNPAEDSVLNNLNDMYHKIIPKYEYNYELLKFIPTPKVVGSRPVGCAVPAEGSNTPLVSMTPIDSNLHTVASCKLAASLKFADVKYQEKINGAQTQLTPGLKFKVVEGYFNDNITHAKNGLVSTGQDGKPIVGIATNFSDIYQSTTNSKGASNNKPRVDQHNYTVEWEGIIVPDETGNWTFSTNSDDASYLWIGDSAATPSVSNALINNGRPHGMRTVRKSIYLNQGTQYHFRMQFGEQGGGYNNILTVTPPTQSKGNNYYEVLFVNDGPMLKQMYYSLRENSRENTKKGLFNCYVTDPNDTTTVPSQVANINNTIVGGYYSAAEYGILWQALNASQVPTSGKISAKMTDDGKFNIVSDNGSTVSTLFDVNNYKSTDTGLQVVNQSSTNPYPAPQYLFLYLRGENWDVNATKAVVSLEMWGWNVGGNGNWQHLSNIFPQGKITVEDSVPNYNWAKQCSFGCCDTNTKLPFILSWNAGWIFQTGITANNHLISWDGRFKLSLSTDGATTNLNLYYSKKPCQHTTTDNVSGAKVVYSAETDGASQYLYSLSVDNKLNKMFYANDLSQSLQYVPSTPNSILKSFGYTEIGSFAPLPNAALKPEDKMKPNKTINDCELKCSNTAGCDNFYYYQDNNGTNYCTLGTQATDGNILPQGAINVVQPGSNIVNPSLYIANKNFNLGPDCMVQPIHVNNITTYENTNNYLKHTVNNSPLNKGQPLGYIVENDYMAWECAQQKMLCGKDYKCPDVAKCLSSLQQSEGFGGMNTASYMVEPYSGYDPNSCTNSSTGCVSFIKEKKLQPLVAANSQFLQTLTDLSNNDVRLSNAIKQHDDIKNELIDNKDAHYSKDDISDDHLLEPVPTILDTANSDTNTLLMQQNNMYIAGTMTTATLLILAIMLGSS